MRQYNEFIWRYLQTMISWKDVVKVVSKSMLKYWNRNFFAQIVKNHFTHTLSLLYGLLPQLCTTHNYRTDISVINCAVCICYTMIQRYRQQDSTYFMCV